jgi:hypothetical protein
MTSRNHAPTSNSTVSKPRFPSFGLALGVLLVALFLLSNALPVVFLRTRDDGEDIQSCWSYGWPVPFASESITDVEACDRLQTGGYWSFPWGRECYHVEFSVAASAVDLCALVGVLLLAHRWRHLRPVFSTRAMLGAFVVVGAYLALWQGQHSALRDQAEVRERLRAASGRVYAPWERLLRADRLVPGKNNVWGIQVAVTCVSDLDGNFISDLEVCSEKATPRFLSIFGQMKCQPPDLSVIGRLRSLEFLQLLHVAVQTRDCQFLQYLRDLRVLKLKDTDVDDELGRLVLRLRCLSVLDVHGTKVGDAFCQDVLTMPQLVALDLANTQVTDSGLSGVARASRLQRLCLEGTRVTNAVLADLVRCPRLTHLNIARTSITDTDLEILVRLPRLEVLVVDEQQVTGGACDAINAIPSLLCLKVVQKRPDASLLDALTNPSVRTVLFSLPEEIEDESRIRNRLAESASVRSFLARQADSRVFLVDEWSLFGGLSAVGYSDDAVELAPIDSRPTLIKRKWRLGFL